MVSPNQVCFCPTWSQPDAEMPRSAAEGLFTGQSSRKSKSPVGVPKPGAHFRRCLPAERQGGVEHGQGLGDGAGILIRHRRKPGY